MALSGTPLSARDLALLRTLHALFEAGSVGGAARSLGLSVAATSHALAKARERLGDPLLVRAGRGMVLTPRAEALRPEVARLVQDAARVLGAATPFAPETLSRTFTLFATDHALLVLGPALDTLLRTEAPGARLQVLPTEIDEAPALREGRADVSICLPGHFPPDFRTRRLMTDRFVCVVREGHPTLARRLTLARYLAAEHVVVAPLGAPSAVDRALGKAGHTRRIARVVPYFMAGLLLAARTDLVLTVSARAAEALAPSLRLRILPPPIALPSYAVNLLWHPRVEDEPADRWFRELIVRAARALPPLAGD